jgi:dCMP deaminase
MDNRPNWDQWFLDIADTVAKRADCSRRKVGALIVRDNRAVSAGYNGALAKERGCLAGGCPRATSNVAPGSQYEHGAGACIAIHAELNAVLFAAKEGLSIKGCSMYITTDPCKTCERLVQQAGIVRVVWPDGELRFDPETS